MPKKFSTIKDIARELNISVATVSRAMRDTYDVSKETREKVLETAVRLNYRPNLNALGLVQRQTHNIGIIIPTITNYYFSTVITGIQEFATANGYNIVLYITNDSPETEMQIVQHLSFSNLDGILACVSPRHETGAHFQEIIDNEIPLIFFDRVADGVKSSRVMQDDYNGAVTAVEHLISRGYRRIAHITGPPNLSLTRSRLKGYQDTLNTHGLSASYQRVVHSGFSQGDGQADTRALFESAAESPDAIFAVNDRKGVGAIMELKRLGIRVGNAVGVVGFTNDPISEIISPTLSTVAEPAYEIGKISCEMLLRQIKSGVIETKEISLSCELIERESTQAN